MHYRSEGNAHMDQDDIYIFEGIACLQNILVLTYHHNKGIALLL
jgi:hypothetical protein